MYYKLQRWLLNRLLGHLYAAESLILLNRINEALPHLRPDNIGELSQLPATDSQPPVPIGTCAYASWYPSNTATGRVVLQFNLSVAYSLRGEFDKAADLLRQVGIPRFDPKYILKNIYMNPIKLNKKLHEINIFQQIVLLSVVDEQSLRRRRAHPSGHPGPLH